MMREELTKWILEIKEIIAEQNDTIEKYLRLEKYLNDYVERIQIENSEYENEYVYNEIYKSINKEDIYMTIVIFSFLFRLAQKPEILEEFIYFIIHNKQLSYQNKNFLFYQIEHYVFRYRCYETKEILVAKWKLLEEICKEIEAELGMELKRIPESELNGNVALVITEQFLSTTHGPTKTALDRCVVLKEELERRVLLINTAEVSSVIGRIPFFQRREGCYDETQLTKEFQEWKGVRVPYIQCEPIMPDIGAEEALLQMVMQLKPSTVINIGGSSVFAGLVNKLIPVLTVGTTQSGLASCLTSFQTHEGKINEKWKNVLWDMERDMSHVIEGRFTFAINEQQERVTREQFGIPKDQFVLLVVGVRLDTEVTVEFMEMLENILNKDIGIAFLGKFEYFAKYKERYQNIAPYMYNLGESQDVLSRMEICDLYVNPIRKGGGTSVVEMMSKGKPAISVAFGDVAGIIGEEFCCKDYGVMCEMIKHYAKDEEFYTQKSELALKVAEECLDSKTEFVRILGEYERRKAQIV